MKSKSSGSFLRLMSRVLLKRGPDLLQAIRRNDNVAIDKIIRRWNSASKTSKLLLGSSRRVNINVQDSDGMSGLHQAALAGNVEIVSLLLENSAEVDIKDNEGMRPIHYAAWGGHSEPASLLLEFNCMVNEPAENGDTPLHLSCQHGHVEVVNLLLYYQANPVIRNSKHRTSLDQACEFGHAQIVDMLLKTNRCDCLLQENVQDTIANDRSTCLHLAARNGHNDVLKLLLTAGVDINRSTLTGTCLHEAAVYGKLDTVKFLLQSGIDVAKTNSYDQTALDIVKKYSTCTASKEIKTLIKEALNAVRVRAVRSHRDQDDPESLQFNEGDILTVLEQNVDGRWRGIIFTDNYSSRSGYFPATAAVLMDRPVGGMPRNSNNAPKASIKKVPPPVVPDFATNRLSVSSYSSGYGSHTTGTDRNSFGSIGPDDAFPPPPSPNTVVVNSSSQSSPSSASTCDQGHLVYAGRTTTTSPQNANQNQGGNRKVSPSSPLDQDIKTGHNYHGGNFTHLHFTHGLYLHQSSMEDQGIDMTQSPGRDSPGSSTGSTTSGGGSSACRNSTSSLDSGRASVYDGRGANQQNRLSGHSYESSSSSTSSASSNNGAASSGSSMRQSYHSSNSSLGSMDKLEEGNTYSTGFGRTINVASMMLHGVEDTEILNNWLSSLNFDEYFSLFVQAGYDMPTISRMTPEDLTAVGITKPGHRKKLKAEIMKLNIPDGLPDFKPDALDKWLRFLKLDQYCEALTQQGYKTVDDITKVAWEDLEEIGIKLLGHQKKMMLAIKRIKDINAGKPVVDRYRQSVVEISHGGVASLSKQSGAEQFRGASDSQYPYGYRTQQITVPSLHTPVPIPSGDDNQGVMEFKTFQQSPPKGEMCYKRHDTGSTSPTHPNMYQCDTINVQVGSPTRVRSIEALDVLDYNNHNQRHLYHMSSSNDNARSWFDSLVRRSNFEHGNGDNGGDITPTNEGFLDGDHVTAILGSNSLPRSQRLIKQKPVARIPAKTRQSSNESLSSNFCDVDAAKSKNNENFVQGSPARQSCRSINSSSKIYGPGLNGSFRKAPPAPPKRTNSMKNTAGNNNLFQDQVFATCVKTMTSSFNMSKQDNRQNDEMPTSDDMPPPPAPLRSAQYCTSSSQVTAQGLSELKQRLESIHNQSPVRRVSHPDLNTTGNLQDIHSTNSLRRQDLKKRDDTSSSSDSSVSNSSGDSTTALPFANDNIGTIKQRLCKGPLLSTLEDIKNRSPLSTLHKASLPSESRPNRDSLCSDRTSSGSELSSDAVDEPKSDQDTGNVLTDIDNMLADLNDELNAMLEGETDQ